MYSLDPVDDGAYVAELNSELRNAHLELLNAHCASYQLRARYSNDQLARFGQPDILRKSAEAAGALRDFYAAVTTKMPQAATLETPHPSGEQIAQAVEWVSSSLRAYRERYWPLARPLSRPQVDMLAPFFSASLLERIRIAELHGARVPLPEFYAQIRALGFDNLPQISHMESLSFLDVIVFNETFSHRGLFHALVHTVQVEVLGLERYAELWVRAFLKTNAHFTVPLEVQAFSLASKFLPPVREWFSVEDEVRQWAAANRY
jgi:hypothetical protein